MWVYFYQCTDTSDFVICNAPIHLVYTHMHAGRGLHTVNGHIGTSPMLVATSHFESPIPKNSYAAQRAQQAAQVGCESTYYLCYC